MSTHKRFARDFVHGGGYAFSKPAAIHEYERRTMRSHQFNKLGMNRAPDGFALRTLRGGSTGQSFKLIEAGHILHRNLDSQVKALRFTRIDNGYSPIDRGE